MYDSHLKLAASKFAGGQGVFTDVDIPADIPICELTGNVLHENELVDKNHPAVLQIGHDLFLSPSGELDDHLNHSCNPNCRLYIVGNRAFLYSLYFIRAKSELTFDYSSSSTDTHDTWNMDCKCGAFTCRKIISGYDLLDDTLKEEFKKKAMIPLFMINKVFQKK